MTVREKQCPKCKKLKPPKQFMRKLTLAQSRAFLKRPTLKTPQEITSKYCKLCQPKPRETLKSIRNRISDGEIHPIIGANLIQEHILKGKMAQSIGMRKVWQKRQDAIITPWLSNIRQQVAKKSNYASLQRSRPKDPHLTAHALLDYETAKAHKAKLELRVKIGEGMKMDLYPHINDYYTPVEKADLVRIKQQVPKTLLLKLRGTR